MNKKRCKALLGLVQLLPAVAAAAAVLFALPRTVPVLAAVPERLTAVVEQPVEAASSEAEEEVLPKLPYADGVYVGSSRGYGGAVRVQVTMENGSITEVEILDASHETKQFLRRAKRLLTTVVETQSWEVDAVSEATYTSRGILGAVQNALTGEVVNNPLPPQPKPAAPLVVEEFTAPSTYLDGIYTAEAIGFEGKITVQITVAEDKITDITLLSAEDEEEYLSRAKQVIPTILEGQSPNVDAVSGATYSSTGILNAVKLALAKAAVAPAEEAEPEQAASEEAAEEACDVKFVRVNGDKERTLAGQFGVTVLPTMLIMNGEQIFRRITGYQSLEAILSYLEMYNAKGRRKMRSVRSFVMYKNSQEKIYESSKAVKPDPSVL